MPGLLGWNSQAGILKPELSGWNFQPGTLEPEFLEGNAPAGAKDPGSETSAAGAIPNHISSWDEPSTVQSPEGYS